MRSMCSASHRRAMFGSSRSQGSRICVTFVRAPFSQKCLSSHVLLGDFRSTAFCSTPPTPIPVSSSSQTENLVNDDAGWNTASQHIAPLRSWVHCLPLGEIPPTTQFRRPVEGGLGTTTQVLSPRVVSRPAQSTPRSIFRSVTTSSTRRTMRLTRSLFLRIWTILLNLLQRAAFNFLLLPQFQRC